MHFPVSENRFSKWTEICNQLNQLFRDKKMHCAKKIWSSFPATHFSSKLRLIDDFNLILFSRKSPSKHKICCIFTVNGNFLSSRNLWSCGKCGFRRWIKFNKLHRHDSRHSTWILIMNHFVNAKALDAIEFDVKHEIDWLRVDALLLIGIRKDVGKRGHWTGETWLWLMERENPVISEDIIGTRHWMTRKSRHDSALTSWKKRAVETKTHINSTPRQRHDDYDEDISIYFHPFF